MSVLFYVMGTLMLLSFFVVPVTQGAGLTGILSALYSGGFLVLLMFGMGRILDVLGDLEEKCDKLETQMKVMSISTSTSEVANDGGWRCICGKRNASYVGTCGCGRKKDGKVMEEKDNE